MNKNILIKEDEQRFRPSASEVERLYSSNEKAKNTWLETKIWSLTALREV